MRPIVALLVAAAMVGAALAEGVATGASRRSDCQRLKDRHRDRSPHPRVVLAMRGDGESGHYAACVLPRGKVRRLVGWSDGLGRDRGWLAARAGYFVVVGSGWGDQYGGNSEDLWRVDVRSGRRLTLASYGCMGDCREGSVGDDLVLHSSGAGAIEVTRLDDRSTSLQAFAPGGAMTVLDDGPVDSLRLDGDEIAWTREGAERRAPLPR